MCYKYTISAEKTLTLLIGVVLPYVPYAHTFGSRRQIATCGTEFYSTIWAWGGIIKIQPFFFPSARRLSDIYPKITNMSGIHTIDARNNQCYLRTPHRNFILFMIGETVHKHNNISINIAQIQATIILKINFRSRYFER